MSAPFTATARLRSDYMRIKRDPVPYISAEPNPSNMLEWHYVVEGPPDTAYAGGFYHGRLVFPHEYPFKPPTIYMDTPSGRFKTRTRLCLSISDFHPDTWNPAWSVSTILTGLLSFMVDNVVTYGSLESKEEDKKILAKKSWQHNLNDHTFVALFPQITQEIQKRKSAHEELLRSRAARSKDGQNRRQIRAAIDGFTQSPSYQSVLSHLFMVVCGVAFLWCVQRVLSGVYDE